MIPTIHQTLEKALVENPDDLATHSAYADYLMEQGDPRGEFIQVQLSLENTSQSSQQRSEFQKREKELLDRYSKVWLGDLGRFLVGDWSGEDKPFHYQFARGWLDSLRVLPFPDEIFYSLSRSPEARLLRRLEVIYDMRYHRDDFDQWIEGPNQALTPEEKRQASARGCNVETTFHPPYRATPFLRSGFGIDSTILPPIIASPFLTNLKTLKLGFDDIDDFGHSTMVAAFNRCDGLQIIELLQKSPRLEELYLNIFLQGIELLFEQPVFSNLRVLQYYYGLEVEYDQPDGYPLHLIALANNPSLKRLTTLRLHPGGRDTSISLEEMVTILQSPNLSSLTHLQIHKTTFGDEGCERIIRSGILCRLKSLDIGYGNLTDEGAQRLANCPDLKHLEELNVTRNALTHKGIKALQATGIRILADNQHNVDEDNYLYDGDYE